MVLFKTLKWILTLQKNLKNLNGGRKEWRK